MATSQAHLEGSTAQQSRLSSGPTKEIVAEMANNLLNAALLEQIETMINRAITARMATPQLVHLLTKQTLRDKSA